MEKRLEISVSLKKCFGKFDVSCILSRIQTAFCAKWAVFSEPVTYVYMLRYQETETE